ncbi:HD domain-containing phosphohydrolase [Propionivibrio sp.]|uniref:HD-GYP domain-containing protein n=1 Tax=Propionivibrio sp. TaxID=2212460 RepID=UPI002605D8A0|nr:HD domain-containing phosphohydrolase [Propionivibrio sp.]
MSEITDRIEGIANARKTFCVVNPHCLESIVRLSEEADVIVSSDIIDESGTKLLARDVAVSRSIQAKLGHRHLQKPLEACLDVVQGASLESIASDCLGLMNKIPALALLGGSSGVEVALRGISYMSLHGPLKLLLTLAKRFRKNNYENNLAAMIICAGLAHDGGLSDQDTDLLILSALLKDIGELYIDPKFLDVDRQLTANEWQRVVAHPLVGQAFLKAFTHFPPALTDSVLQHHERQDGNGYPFQLSAANMSPLGMLNGLADCVSAIVMGNNVTGEFARDSELGSRLGERVAVALTIVPDEFPPKAIAFVTKALAPLNEVGTGSTGGSFAQRILPTLQRIRSARLLAETLSSTVMTPGLGRIGSFALSAIRDLDKRLRATGVYDLSQLDVFETDPTLMEKTCLVLAEVNWRLRHLARKVYMRTEQGRNKQAQVAELVSVLSMSA